MDAYVRECVRIIQNNSLFNTVAIAGRRETNVIYHYSNIDPCETIKVHDYMYAKRKNQ